ncbi:F0F1 ATP synthase subunit delta [Helicobacter sp. MIT 14-3879]|uniref:F0F1 ATP synthase subunit delta n=1 Tax=Helicobacter sp. MIT 14-3879 TaxID=2040649 RepID=UPI000E1F38EF|nr:F0F1 ATP synthase subunit delta [Helicobacter sp. MIT 14-3879]RDU63164.1 ATP synthase F1 subunit delta [Helicobacter sp. MIT 14-3879]
MNSASSKKYTKALVNALNKLEINKALESLNILSNCFSNKNFNSIINSPTISRERKVNFILSILEIKDEKLSNFIKLLSQKNRLNEIPNIYDELSSHVRSQNNEFELMVSSSFELDSKDLEHIKTTMENKLKTSLYVTQKRTEIDGIKLFVDGIGIETSFLKNNFSNNIKNHILKAFN